MRRVICLMVLASVLLLPGVAQASFPTLTVDLIGRGRLVSGGASVLVPLDVTCTGLVSVDFVVLSMVLEQDKRGSVFTGSDVIEVPDGIVCDGSVHRFEIEVIADSHPFLGGLTLATADGQVCGHDGTLSTCTGEGSSTNTELIRLLRR